MKYFSNEERLEFLIGEYEKELKKLNKLNNDKFMFLTKFNIDKFKFFNRTTLFDESKKINDNITLIENKLYSYSYEISKTRYCIKEKIQWYWYC